MISMHKQKSVKEKERERESKTAWGLLEFQYLNRDLNEWVHRLSPSTFLLTGAVGGLGYISLWALKNLQDKHKRKMSMGANERREQVGKLSNKLK